MLLLKFFGARKRNPPPGDYAPPNPNPIRAREKPSALKIVHAGGIVERYYMAVPAARIMEKHPNFILARPEVFRQPWESVVEPGEILIPGQKYYIVPTRTLKKLRQRMRQPNGGWAAAGSFASESSIDVSRDDVSQEKDALSSKSLLGEGISFAKPKSKIIVVSRHVCIGGKSKKASSSSVVCMEKKGNADRAGVEKSSISSEPTTSGKKVRFSVTWEPSLTVIAETHSSQSHE